MRTVLGYANQIEAASLSGGYWLGGYPLSNLQNRYLHLKARTINATTLSTVIAIDLGAAQPVGVLALINHNLTAAATVRIQGADNSGQSPTLYDSTALTIYEGQDYAIAFPSTAARYWRVSIEDTGNPAGYVELGRVFFGPAFEPEINLDWGPGIGVQSSTGVLASLGGPEYFSERANRRTWRGQWSWLTASEAYNELLPLLRALDVSGEVYLLEDADDPDYLGQRGFLGRMRTLNPIEWPYLNARTHAVEISELL